MPRLFVYQTLFSLIQDVSHAANSRIYDALGTLFDTVSADDVISAIVKSRDSRKTLLQFANELGIYGDERLRDALRRDEEQIADFILAILNSVTERAAVLRLEGDSAQYFLDVVQNTLDRGYLIQHEHSSKARRIIVKLSEACDKLPSSLFITGVTGRDEHATFGGGFGDIYRASYAGKRVALKHIRTFRDAENRRMRLQFCREALVWQHLQHPFILPLIGIDRDTFPPSICMVSPWMEHGTVLKYLNDYGRANVDKLLSEIAQGMQYLHSKNIVHGDLRGANILITHEWSACLADFGLTSLSDATTATHTSHRAGSIRWMAPELIDPERFGHRFVRTPATDIYAFGCVCLELYTGRPPFADLSETATLLKVINGERPEYPSAQPAMSEALWKHVNAYWAQESATRPPTEVVVEHLGGRRQLDYNVPRLNQISLDPETVSTPESGASTPHRSFPVGNSVVTCLILSKGRIISASDEHLIHVHDALSGELRLTLKGHEGGVWSVAATGDVLVSGSTDRTVRIWDLISGLCTHVFGGHTGTVRALAIVRPEWVEMDDGRREKWPKRTLIVTGSRDHTLRVWMLPRSGEAGYSSFDEADPNGTDDNPYHRLSLKGHDHAVRALAARGRTLVSGSYDCTVRVWDIITGACRWVLVGHTQKVYSVVLDPPRHRAYSGSMDGTVRIWDLKTGDCTHTLKAHTSLVALLGLSPRMLVSASADSTVRVWDPDTGALLHTLAGHTGAITCFQHTDSKLLSGSDGTLKMWDLRDGSVERDLLTGLKGVSQIVLNGRWCVAATNQIHGRTDQSVIDVWDLAQTGEDWGYKEGETDAEETDESEDAEDVEMRENQDYENTQEPTELDARDQPQPRPEAAEAEAEAEAVVWQEIAL